MNKNSHDKCNILGSWISVESLAEVTAAMRDAILKKNFGYICVSNVHTVVTGKEDCEYQNITNNAFLATADGVPLLWASRLLGLPIHGRASGPDIMELFFEQDGDRRYRHYFFGSTPEVLDALKTAVTQRWPGTKIVGTFSPPFAKPSAQLDEEHVIRINESQADIVWVGLGAPKQEQWMARMRAQSNPSLLIGVGAAFDFLSGNKKRAPLWMQKFGLEWLFRLMSEPRRLFPRYAVTNTLFICYLFIQLISKK